MLSSWGDGAAKAAIAALAAFSLASVGARAEAPAGGGDADALAKQLSNPVASLISVPLQLNWDDGLGTGGDGERWLLNVQPVAPFALNDEWNIISRTILPVIHQDVPPGGSESGIGDVTQSLFFSPKHPTASGWIWGVGPAFQLPTASEDVLGTEQWALGPTAVVLKQTQDGWTYGALVNYLVSVAGDDDRADVNSMFVQPFLAKALGKGRTLTAHFESTYDFEAQQWNAPFNLTFSEVTKNRRAAAELRIRRALLPRVTGRRRRLGTALRRDAAVPEVASSVTTPASRTCPRSSAPPSTGRAAVRKPSRSCVLRWRRSPTTRRDTRSSAGRCSSKARPTMRSRACARR